MSRPRFSEALVTRRHELGLSVSQASKILKLREDVLIAFEEGDYDHLPQSGYAQGMLSSYARYLGLNAREIVDLFQEDLYVHQTGTASHELRRRTRDTQAGRGISGYDLVNEAGSRPKAYVEYRPLLPTSGGPAGDMGYFATTAPARSRSSVPLVGSGAAAPGTHSSYASPAREVVPAYPRYDERRRPYNSAPERERPAREAPRRRAADRRRRPDDQAGRLISEGQRTPERAYDARGQLRSGRLYRRDDVSTRRVRPSEYTDDMRYDDRANPYAPASTISGRRSSRNIASVERPNVRRRPSSQGGRGGRRPPARGGVLGAVEGFFSDPRRTLFAVIVVATAIITAILIFSVGSCVRGANQQQPQETVEVNNATQDEKNDDAATTPPEEGDADADAEDPSAADDANADDAEGDPAAGDAEGDAADDEPEEYVETVVTVEVASGGYSWLEIVCDGQSIIAEGTTGPWSQEFTVYDSITVQVGDSSVVTVTENGEPVEFTSSAGGVESVTIKGTPRPEGAEDEEGAAAGAEGDAAGDESYVDVIGGY